MKRRHFAARAAVSIIVSAGALLGTGNHSTASAAQATTVRVAINNFNSYHLAQMIAHEKPQFMKEQDIEVTWIQMASVAAAIPALVSGSVDFATTTTENVLQARATGADVKLIARESSGARSLVVSPSIKEIEDLVKKPLPVLSNGLTVDWVAFQALFHHYKVDPSKTHYVSLGSDSAIVASMTAGRYDACIVQQPFISQLEQAGMRVLMVPTDLPIYKNHKTFATGITAMPKWYTENHDVAVRFMRGLVNANRWMFDPDNKSEVIKIISKSQKTTSTVAEDLYSAWITGGAAAKSMAPSVEFLKNQIELDKVVGLKGIDRFHEDDATLGDSVDASLIDEAEK